MSRVFYQGTVRSHINTDTNLTRSFALLAQSLPRPGLSDRTTYFQLTGYAYFLDVPNGRCVYSPGRSSENLLEANVALSLARSLCTIRNVAQNDILDLNGYTRQVNSLQRLAQGQGLFDLRFKIVEGSQADDAPFVILSVVRDSGDLGFLRTSSRANVATSRQKSALYIIGNWNVADADSRTGAENHFRRYLEHARSQWPNYVLSSQAVK